MIYLDSCLVIYAVEPFGESEQFKRTGRGYRNPVHYKTRILLTSAD